MGDEAEAEDTLADQATGAAAETEQEGAKTGNFSVPLPPRKRLLVGLKHCSTSSCSPGHTNGNSGNKKNGFLPLGMPLSPSLVCPEGLVTMSEGALLEAAEKKSQGEASGFCRRCRSKESVAWRRVQEGGVYQHLCDSCTLLYMCCPFCLVVFQEAGASVLWLSCCQCGRSVHVECEAAANPGCSPEASTYLCSQCRRSGEVCEDGERLSPCSKRPRMGSSRSRDGEGEGDEQGGQEEEDEEHEQTPEEALTAARDAAEQALKVAQTAKATAAAKAQAAVKAAMLARNALQNAALAHSSSRSEVRVKVEVPEKVKTAEENDEELARQLHRAMNSSTRNARKI